MKSELMVIFLSLCLSLSLSISLALSFSHTPSVGIFAYRLLRADYYSNQNQHNQRRQLARLGLCWFCMWPLASDGLEHSWIISTSILVIPTPLHLLQLGSAFHLQLLVCVSSCLFYVETTRYWNFQKWKVGRPHC